MGSPPTETGSEHGPATSGGKLGQVANDKLDELAASIKQESPAISSEQGAVGGGDKPVSGAGKVADSRQCVLCNMQGDAGCTVSPGLCVCVCVCQPLSRHCCASPAQEAGRLLPCTVDEWVHANCAVWSAEVYEECSGLLRDVHTAISRGTRLVRAVISRL